MRPAVKRRPNFDGVGRGAVADHDLAESGWNAAMEAKP